MSLEDDWRKIGITRDIWSILGAAVEGFSEEYNWAEGLVAGGN